MLSRTSLSTRFFLVALISIGLFTASAYFIAKDVYETELQNKARIVADNVTDFGAWVSQYGRVWVKESATNKTSFLGKAHFREIQTDANVYTTKVLELLQPEEFKYGKFVTYYSKNPALAQREFSEVVARSSSEAKFRMTSDNYMNPENKPDEFEAGAIATIKEQGLKEYFSIEGTEFRYARAVHMKETCITCHGTAESAPTELTSKYGTKGGFGFKAGDVAGVISVRIPMRFSLVTVSESFSSMTWVALSLMLIGVLMPIWAVRRLVVKPLRSLTEAADRVSTGKMEGEMDLLGATEGSRNEIHQMTLALTRLNASLVICMKRFTGGS